MGSWRRRARDRSCPSASLPCLGCALGAQARPHEGEIGVVEALIGYRRRLIAAERMRPDGAERHRAGDDLRRRLDIDRAKLAARDAAAQHRADQAMAALADLALIPGRKIGEIARLGD